MSKKLRLRLTFNPNKFPDCEFIKFLRGKDPGNLIKLFLYDYLIKEGNHENLPSNPVTPVDSVEEPMQLTKKIEAPKKPCSNSERPKVEPYRFTNFEEEGGEN